MSIEPKAPFSSANQGQSTLPPLMPRALPFALDTIKLSIPAALTVDEAKMNEVIFDDWKVVQHFLRNHYFPPVPTPICHPPKINHKMTFQMLRDEGVRAEGV